MPTSLLLTTDAVGGVWRYTMDLASGLAERGERPVVAVLGPAANPVQRREAEAIPNLHLVQTGLPLDWTADTPAALNHAGERLAALAALMGVQTVHLHAPALIGAATWPVPVIAVCHSDVGTWWKAMRATPPPPDFAWRIELTGQGLRRAAGIIAPTSAHADAVRAVYGALTIAVVHNGTAASHHPGVGLKSSGHTGRNAPSVLTAGRLWDEAKAVAVLDAAAPFLKAPVRAAGAIQGPNGASIQPANLQQLGMLDPVAMGQAYQSATVFASMARYEPFGLAVLEAAQTGLRLVLSDIPTFRELWDGVATFVTNPADLAATLQRALDTPGDGGARERAASYTLEKMTDRTLAIHRDLAA